MSYLIGFLVCYAWTGIGVAIGLMMGFEDMRSRPVVMVFWCAAFWPLAPFIRSVEDTEAPSRQD